MLSHPIVQETLVTLTPLLVIIAKMVLFSSPVVLVPVGLMWVFDRTQRGA